MPHLVVCAAFFPPRCGDNLAFSHELGGELGQPDFLTKQSCTLAVEKTIFSAVSEKYDEGARILEHPVFTAGETQAQGPFAFTKSQDGVSCSCRAEKECVRVCECVCGRTLVLACFSKSWKTPLTGGLFVPFSMWHKGGEVDWSGTHSCKARVGQLGPPICS